MYMLNEAKMILVRMGYDQGVNFVSGITDIRIFCIEWRTHIEPQNLTIIGCDFDTVATDFVGTAVDFDFHYSKEMVLVIGSIYKNTISFICGIPMTNLLAKVFVPGRILSYLPRGFFVRHEKM